MLKSSEIKEVKRLIKKGYDLDIIALELGQDIEEIEKCKEYPRTEMQKIRERYNKIYSENREKHEQKSDKIPQKDKEKIESIISNIETILNDIKPKNKKERRKGAVGILGEIKKLDEYQLTSQQLERVNIMLQAKEIKFIIRDENDHIEREIYYKRKRILKKLLNSINIEQEQTEDLGELQELKGKITIQILNEEPILARTVSDKIRHKMDKIKMQTRGEKKPTELSENIENIIINITNGTLDIQSAKKIIEEEIELRLNNGPKNKFALTEEQIRRQIMMQIRSAISKQAEKYYIKEPDKAISQLQQLEQEIVNNIRAVVMNLVQTKRFEQAKETCEIEYGKSKNNINLALIKNIRKEIKNAEISNMILKGIKMDKTEKEEEEYFRLIDSGLKTSNVNLSDIVLGKSKDGLKTITLEDIWIDEEERRI